MRHRRWPRLGVVTSMLLLVACRVEDRSPDGSRRDEEAIRNAVTGYYRGLAQGNWPASRALFWDSAQVQIRAARAWQAFASPDDFGRYLASRPATTAPEGIRPLRIDARQEGDVAAAWAETRRGDAARSRSGTTDHFVLRRIEGSWRITNLTASIEPVDGTR